MTEIKVGSLVRVRHNVNRKSRVEEIRLNCRGAMVYILEDGGWFDLGEIEAIRDFRWPTKPIRYRCTVCGDNYVDAESGYDTCGDCLAAR